MTELAIIADDLSGALDSAAPFAAHGHHTFVALSPAALGKALETGADIVAVSTDSRDIDPQAARARVEAALAQLPAGTKLFKKVDSRLKGNLVGELDAFSFRNALVVPAIPAFGRWTRGGVLGGFGIDNPIDIAGRLGPHVTRATVPDATTHDDIRAALAGGEYDLLVGARALAEAQAERMGQGPRSARVVSHRGPVVLVIGSTDPITLAQVAHLRQSRPDATYIAASNGVVSGRIELTAEITIVHATPGEGHVGPAAVARGLATALEALDPPQDALLIVSGGATAQVVLEHFGIEIVEVLGEVLPGIPVADSGRFKLITKSGGFGEPDAFARVLERQGRGEPIGAV